MGNKRMVYAKHSSCPLCGASKTHAIAAERAARKSQPGDWQCPNSSCLNHKNKVFAKYSACPKCGKVKSLEEDKLDEKEEKQTGARECSLVPTLSDALCRG